MSDIKHFKDVSYVNGCVTVELDLSKYNERLNLAQQWLGDMVLQSCKPYMPIVTGSLQQRSAVIDDGKKVVFPGPYARYLYMGKKMVDSVTGRGPMRIYDAPEDSYIFRYRKGAKLIATDKPLTYSSAKATAQWFETAKSKDKEHWIDGIKDILGGGNGY